MLRRPTLRSTVTTLAAAAILVGGADLASYAATGQPLSLGHANTAGTTTSLKNVGRGPALSLNSAKSSPPLTVNSSKMVKHLNANKLGGLTASQVNAAYALYTVGKSGRNINVDVPHFSIVKPPVGYVHWSMTGIWTSQTTTDSLECVIFDKRFLHDPTNLRYIYAEFSKASSDPDGPFLQQQGVAHFTKNQKLLIGCEGSGTGPLQIVQPLTFAFHSISAKVKHGTPFNPARQIRPSRLG